MMSKPLSTEKQQEIMHEQPGHVPVYLPSSEESTHIAYIFKRKDEIIRYYQRLGLYAEWDEAERAYENRQRPSQRDMLPTLNCGTEIEVVETKSSEEKEVMPEVVLMPRFEDDRVKAEAMQELFEHIKIKNQDDLKKSEMIDHKNIYGVAYQEISWCEKWRVVKEVTAIEESGDEEAETPVARGKIPKLTWKEHRVIDYKDIKIENVPVQDLLFSENAKTIEEANECIRLWYGDYDDAKQAYGDFPNFDYVQKSTFPRDLMNMLTSKRVSVGDEIKKVEVIVLRYWNRIRDEYSIVINGVLMTQPGNPIPQKYWKDFPFTRAACRRMVGDRAFHPKGDVILVNRLKQMKSLLANAITKSVVTNAVAVLITTKEVAAKLQKTGKQWQSSGVLEVSSKDNAQATRTLQVESDPSGAIALIQKIDEMITTLVGVDARSLLTTVQETATKTAVRRETMLKRVSAGLKLIENEALYRKARIILALIRENYDETESFYNKNELGLDNPSVIKVPRVISTRDKKFKWVRKYRPVSKDDIVKVLTAGADAEFIGMIFSSTDGGDSFNFLPKSREEMEQLKRYGSMPDPAKTVLEEIIDASTFFDLEKSDSVGKIETLVVKKELFDVPYDIHIVPKGAESYSKAFQREQLEKLAQTYLGTPFVNSEELARAHIKSEGLDADRIVRSADESQAAAQDAAGLKAAEKGIPSPLGSGAPPAGGMPIPSEGPAASQQIPPELAAAFPPQ